MILNSPTISGSLTVTGNILTSGSITLSGSVASASYAATASFVALAQSASNAVAAATASSADNLLVRNTLTAQTLVVQTITSSVDFVTGSTRFGSIIDNTHVFTGSMSVSGSGTFNGNVTLSNTSTPLLQLVDTTNSKSLLVGVDDNNTFIRSSTSTPILFQVNGGDSALTLSSAGAATFASSVTASGATINGLLSLNSGGTERFVRLLGYNSSYVSIRSNVGFDSSYNAFNVLVNSNSNDTGQGNSSVPSWQMVLGGNLPDNDSFCISRSPAGSFTFANLFKLTSAGAATFSSGLQGLSYGITNESVFRGGLYAYKGVSGSGTDFGITIFAEGGTGNGNIYFCPGGSATRQVTIASSGYVGIGITSPTHLLSLYGSTQADIKFQNSGATRAYIWSNSAELAFNSLTSNPIKFFVDDVERMRINASGYIKLKTVSSVYSNSTHRIDDYQSSEGNVILVTGNASQADTFIAYSVAQGNQSGTATGLAIGRNSSTGRSINAGGTINASGADYAEYMYKAITDIISKGDIVGVNTEGQLTNIFADAVSFVVKSTDPSYVGGDVWGNSDVVGEKPDNDATQEKKDEYNNKLEIERAKVDRIAFSGQVPCNVTGANVGDYIIPIELENGKIGGQAITNPTFEQYQISVGKVWKIMEDGRAWIAVKIG